MTIRLSSEFTSGVLPTRTFLNFRAEVVSEFGILDPDDVTYVWRFGDTFFYLSVASIFFVFTQPGPTSVNVTAIYFDDVLVASISVLVLAPPAELTVVVVTECPVPGSPVTLNLTENSVRLIKDYDYVVVLYFSCTHLATATAPNIACLNPIYI